jgi:hypothetical protein
VPQDPYRTNRPDVLQEEEHPAAKAASIALIAIVVAWFALGDQALGRNDFIVGLFITAVALLAGWRAGKNR